MRDFEAGRGLAGRVEAEIIPMTASNPNVFRDNSRSRRCAGPPFVLKSPEGSATRRTVRCPGVALLEDQPFLALLAWNALLRCKMARATKNCSLRRIRFRRRSSCSSNPSLGPVRLLIWRVTQTTCHAGPASCNRRRKTSRCPGSRTDFGRPSRRNWKVSVSSHGPRTGTFPSRALSRPTTVMGVAVFCGVPSIGVTHHNRRPVAITSAQCPTHSERPISWAWADGSLPDCQCSSKNWIQEMTSSMSAQIGASIALVRRDSERRRFGSTRESVTKPGNPPLWPIKFQDPTLESMTPRP